MRKKAERRLRRREPANPQRFGFLPTPWFWDSVMRDKASPLLVVCTLIFFVLWAWGSVILNRWLPLEGLPGLARVGIYMLEGGIVVTLVTGFSERAIRRAALRRRERQAIAGASTIVGSGPPGSAHVLGGAISSAEADGAEVDPGDEGGGTTT
ncbi:MAG: hypothetical protein D6705_05040 [Deltaproteobacteria bacterium]|nr:MAG: hypothetical protein D6705_05040 [Deltaproteobacteria bacterium]